jgi:hypothetical protein
MLWLIESCLRNKLPLNRSTISFLAKRMRYHMSRTFLSESLNLISERETVMSLVENSQPRREFFHIISCYHSDCTLQYQATVHGYIQNSHNYIPKNWNGFGIENHEGRRCVCLKAYSLPIFAHWLFYKKYLEDYPFDILNSRGERVIYDRSYVIVK